VQSAHPPLWRAVTIALVAVLFLVPAGGAGIGAIGAARVHAGPAMFHAKGSSTRVSSTNWAGWAITTGNGAVTDVKGSWIVPKIQGTCPATAQYSSFWIGIDGYSSTTVEQIGTDSDCQGGSPVYYAWYEFYPSPSHLITKVPIHPGNVIAAEVHFGSSKFTLTLTDLNTSKTVTKNSTVKGSRNSAEWIAEAPSSGSGVLPLADFGKVRFGPDATGDTGTGSATISGTTGALGSFANSVEITMINNAGTGTKAAPSSLTPDGTSFNVTWKAAGP
jgi:Peptidase A4 family